MKVECKANKISPSLGKPVFERLRNSVRIDGEISELCIGKEYLVMAIEERNGGSWVFIHTVPQSGYPYPYPIELFDIVDSKIPDDWSMKFNTGERGVLMKRLSFKEWANNDSFYEDLVDGQPEATRIYKSHIPKA